LVAQRPPVSGSTLFYGIPQVKRQMVQESSFDVLGPWKLPRWVGYRYGLEMVEGYDQRRDTLLSFTAARSYFVELSSTFGKDALWAYLQGAVAFRKHPIDSVHQQDWIRALSGYGKTERSLAKEQLYDTIWGPQIWPKAESFSSFFDSNPAITGDVKDSVALIIRVDSITSQWDSLWSKNQRASYIVLKQKTTKRSKVSSGKPSDKEGQKPSKKPVVYKVKTGDNLGGIASRYGVSVGDLKSWNHLRSDLIRIGQALTVFPNPKTQPNTLSPRATKPTGLPKEKKFDASTEGTFYIIQPGETLWSIARQFTNLTPNDLMKYNQISENIRAGDEILIPVNAIKK